MKDNYTDLGEWNEPFEFSLDELNELLLKPDSTFICEIDEADYLNTTDLFHKDSVDYTTYDNFRTYGKLYKLTNKYRYSSPIYESTNKYLITLNFPPTIELLAVKDYFFNLLRKIRKYGSYSYYSIESKNDGNLHYHQVIESDLTLTNGIVQDNLFQWHFLSIINDTDNYKHCINYLFKSFDKHYLKYNYDRNLTRDNKLKGSSIRRYGRTLLNKSYASLFDTTPILNKILLTSTSTSTPTSELECSLHSLYFDTTNNKPSTSIVIDSYTLLHLYFDTTNNRRFFDTNLLSFFNSS